MKYLFRLGAGRENERRERTSKNWKFCRFFIIVFKIKMQRRKVKEVSELFCVHISFLFAMRIQL